MDKSIFIRKDITHKKEESIIFPQEEIIIKKDDLSKIIPTDSLEEENQILNKTLTEWRWKLFEINGKSYTEISKKEVDKERLFKNKYGLWVSTSPIDNNFDEFLVKKYYYYSSN